LKNRNASSWAIVSLTSDASHPTLHRATKEVTMPAGPSTKPQYQRTLTLAAMLALLACAATVQSAENGPPDDSAIAIAVTERLFDDPGVSNLLIDVTVEEGVVYLTGSVVDLAAKERAKRLAATVNGVRAVVDRVGVVPHFRPDDELEAAVEAALGKHPAVDAERIEVEVKDQGATLTGTADSQAERNIAGRVARGVAGLEALDNRIQVEPPSQRPDAEIEQEIESILAWDALIDDDQVRFQVDSGRVTLEGTVDSWFERTVAEENAYAGGAVIVDNDLRVRYGPDYYSPDE
jgi:osmotically-inducible protein OsmY